MTEPLIGYLAGVAASVTANILGHFGKQLPQSITGTPRQAALQRCYQATLAAMLPEQDPLRERYDILFETFLAEQSVTAELAKLIRGREPDTDSLSDIFDELIEGQDLPIFDLSTRLAAGIEAFLATAEQEPDLSEIMRTANLREATKHLRSIDLNIDAIRQAVVLAQASRGNVEGRDITAHNIVTGSQINHIIQVYQAGKGSWDAEDYRKALREYLGWLRADMGHVVLRGIKRGGQQAIDLSLHEVYVPLAAEILPEERELLKRRLHGHMVTDTEQFDASDVNLLVGAAQAERISMQQLVPHGNRLAVIGAPGCGKTTVLQHIAWTLAEALREDRPAFAEERLGLSGPLPLPIYVPFSLYATHRHRFADHPKPHQRQLATFINHYLIERQAGLNLPDDFFASLLDQGQHVLLLLDGLDEVPSEDERAVVSQAVRDLTISREQVRLVVTSRTQAYQGRSVLGRDFRVVRVLPLDPDNVDDLIRCAYQAIYPGEEERAERLRHSDSLIHSVRTLEAERAARFGDAEEHRLVTTPLFVRMLLIVHFNMRRLPDQRAELYMAVIDTLLTADYNPDATVAQHVAQLGGEWRARRDMLQYLAFHMHSRGAEAGREIAERDLTEVLTAYLQDRRQMAPDMAKACVTDLVTMSRQRGGVLEERGGQYRFSHLSFQEFLTARYLAEVERDVSRIVSVLHEHARLTDSWWRKPILLLGGYLHVEARDTATNLVQRLARGDTEPPASNAAALASAELAATIFLEWDGVEATRYTVAGRLVDLLTDPALPDAIPPQRATAGRTLGLLGDPREGVGTREILPDLAWCELPAGPFPCGARKDDEEAYDNEKPQCEVHLPAFYIARYPFTNVQFGCFIAADGYNTREWWTEAGWAWRNGAEPDLSEITDESLKRAYSDWLESRPADLRHEPLYGHDERFNLPNQPVTGVNWYEAMAFCAWLYHQYVTTGQSITVGANRLESLLNSGTWQIRLPTEAEWEKAAGWESDTELKRLYAWGDDWDTSKVNADSVIGGPSAIGIFPSGSAASGTQDMTGNVWEWTHSLFHNYPYRVDDGREGEESAGLRTLRGGAWSADRRYARVSYRFGTHPASFFDFLGCRVVAAPVFCLLSEGAECYENLQKPLSTYLVLCQSLRRVAVRRAS